ncbi:Alpha/Beta hydrolase protein [Mycena floridula]|nr:Alpha/Beta hydrolase protein [Mycena floridula]
MDPQDPASFSHRTETLATGRKYHFIDELPAHHNGQTLILVHGFPDFWYGWRFLIPEFARKGYRVIAPDMLGCGSTDKPFAVEEYTTKKLCADLAALLDLLAIPRAIFIGHDWGSFTVGRMGLWHPERLQALIMISVPYTPPSREYFPVQEVARRIPDLQYQVYFASQRSTKEIEGNLRQFLELIFNPSTELIESLPTDSRVLAKMSGSPTPVLNEKELDHYQAQFSGAMNGPLNYYRTAQLRHEEELAAALPASLRPDLPCLFLWGTCDSTAPPSQIAKASKFIPRLQQVAFEGHGHWLMVKARTQVTDKILSWLADIDAVPAKL